ncbi:MAG: bifunctional riboflavin kinase/FAD synthetase [Actinomycetota bacterium]
MIQVYRGLSELPPERGGVALTIGNFDGVHRGHLAIIRRVLSLARATQAIPTVVTFDPHPQAVLRGQAPSALITPERKVQLLSEAGMARLVTLPFDRALSLVEPEEFIERILVKELGVKAVVVGSNFRFGHFARGDISMLRAYGRRLGYTFQTVRILEANGRRISSTEIRHALGEGDIAWATLALGRPHVVPGTVVAGAGRGRRRLGFPTANLEPPPGFCLPQLGIYAAYLHHGGRRQPCAVSVGTNPTYGANPISVEAHVLDFEGDLCGQNVALELVTRLRPEKTFASEEALTEAIASDVAAVRRLLMARETQG